jgi:hypothetical protein
MRPRRSETDRLQTEHAVAEERIRIWTARGAAARKEGRDADASRCEDKVRDWCSKVRQIERQRSGGEM